MYRVRYFEITAEGCSGVCRGSVTVQTRVVQEGTWLVFGLVAVRSVTRQLGCCL